MNFVVNSVALSLSCHKLLLLSQKNHILRRISVFGRTKGNPALFDKTNHKVIYEFKYIVLASAVSKFKYMLPAVSVPFISAGVYFNQPTIAVLITVASFLQFILMLAISRLTANTIGKIYVNKEGKINNVIISFIDSNGTRMDKSFSSDQFYLSELPLTRFLGFLLVECKGKNYKINVKSAHIYDKIALKSIFHDIFLFIDKMYVNKNR